MAAISTHSLSIGYREPLFSGLELELEEGRLTSLLGLNGAGKTTLFRLLCGIEEFDSGSIVKEKGVKKIFAGATHGLFSRDAVANFNKALSKK